MHFRLSLAVFFVVVAVFVTCVVCMCAQLLTLIPGWACFFYLLYSMTDDAEIKGFDPFAILGVTPSMGEKEIKKQFRALSLIYHPDKVCVDVIHLSWWISFEKKQKNVFLRRCKKKCNGRFRQHVVVDEDIRIVARLC